MAKFILAFIAIISLGQAKEAPNHVFDNQRLISLKQALNYSESQCNAPKDITTCDDLPNLADADPLVCKSNREIILPSEILAHTLSFLNEPNDLLTLSLVCKSWNIYFHNNLKNQCLVLNDKSIANIPTPLLETIGGLFFNLSTPNYQALSDILNQTKNLRYLALRFSGISKGYFKTYPPEDDSEFTSFNQAINKLAKLQYFDLFKSNIKIFDLNPHKWSFTNELRLLNFGYNDVAKKGQTCTSFLDAMIKIEVISLQGISCLTTEPVEFALKLIASAQDSKPTIKFMNLNGTKVSRENVEKLRAHEIQIFFAPYQADARQEMNNLFHLVTALKGAKLSF